MDPKIYSNVQNALIITQPHYKAVVDNLI